MLSFPNEPYKAPLDWVPRGLASYTTLQCDIKNAFEFSTTLIDEASGGENVLEDLIVEIKKDENGPQIDIRKDLVGHVGQRVTVVTDYKLPITPTSERLLFAAETTNEKALAEAVKKSLQDDPDVIKRTFGDYVIWEMKAEEPPVAAVVIEHPGGGDGAAAKPEGKLEGKPAEKKVEDVRLPNAAIAVAKGHLFVSSHVDFLEKILGKLPERERLGDDVDFRRVNEELKKLGAEEVSVRNFSRVDDEYRVTYELFREGKLPQADTVLAKLINRILGEDKEGVVRKPKLDGSKLPEFDVVRRYLGVGGSYVTSEKDGWLMVGFVLNKEPLSSEKSETSKAASETPVADAAKTDANTPKADAAKTDGAEPKTGAANPAEAPKTDAIAPTTGEAPKTDAPKSE